MTSEPATTELAPLPERLVERLREIFTEAVAETVIQRFTSPPRQALRINTLKADWDATVRQLRDDGINAVRIPGFGRAFTIPEAQQQQVAAHPLVKTCAVYLHPPSHMLGPLALKVRPGHQVLDLAPTQGGEILQLATLMKNSGRLAVAEPIRVRYLKINDLFERAGVTIGRCDMTHSCSVGTKTPDRYDRVLLDAPCSGEARFDRRNRRTWKYWSRDTIAENASRQKSLLTSAITATRPGGACVYTTSTFAPEENEAVLQYVLDRFGDDIFLDNIDLPEAITARQVPALTQWRTQAFDESIANARRILPDDTYDGLFIARLRKRNWEGL
mgnify:CR=1 FL=1